MKTFTNEFINNLSDSDYKLHHYYMRLDECIEIICRHYLVPKPEQITPIKLNGIEGIYFLLNDSILVDYKVRVIGERFELYEMIISTYNRFENQLLEKLRSEDNL